MGLKRGRKRPDYIYRCKKCGTLVDMREFTEWNTEQDEMVASRLCVSCKYWYGIRERAGKDVEVIGGEVYQCSDVSSAFRNHKNIYLMRPGRIVEARRVCGVIGPVPAPFAHVIHDTGRLLKRETYMIGRNLPQGYKCARKGCFDRYRCFWYDRNGEGKAWNRIPKTHITGGEGCPIFIQRTKAWL